jgi:hypothetical protein
MRVFRVLYGSLNGRSRSTPPPLLTVTFLACPRKVTQRMAPDENSSRCAQSSSVHFGNSPCGLRQSEMLNPRTWSHAYIFECCKDPCLCLSPCAGQFVAIAVRMHGTASRRHITALPRQTRPSLLLRRGAVLRHATQFRTSEKTLHA